MCGALWSTKYNNREQTGLLISWRKNIKRQTSTVSVLSSQTLTECWSKNSWWITEGNMRTCCRTNTRTGGLQRTLNFIWTLISDLCAEISWKHNITKHSDFIYVLHVNNTFQLFLNCCCSYCLIFKKQLVSETSLFTCCRCVDHTDLFHCFTPTHKHNKLTTWICGLYLYLCVCVCLCVIKY